MSAQENPTALQQLPESLRAQAAEPAAQALVGDRAQLLGHREAILFEAAFRCWNRQVQGIAEVGSGERHGEGEIEARLVQLIDRDDHEGAGLCLLPASRRVGVRPVDVALPGLLPYHSGVGASKPDSISSLSAR